MEKRDSSIISNEIEGVIDNELLPQVEKQKILNHLIDEFYKSLPSFEIIEIVEPKSPAIELGDILKELTLLLPEPTDDDKITFETKIPTFDEERKKSVMFDFLYKYPRYYKRITEDKKINLITNYLNFRERKKKEIEGNLKIEERDKKVGDLIDMIEKKRFSQLSSLNFVEIMDNSEIKHFYEKHLDNLVKILEYKHKIIDCDQFQDGFKPIIIIKGNKILYLIISEDVEVISSSYINFDKKELKNTYKRKYHQLSDYDSRNDVDSKERISFERWMRAQEIDPKRHWKDEDNTNSHSYDDEGNFEEWYDDYDGEPKRTESYHYINRLDAYKCILRWKILYFDTTIQEDIDNFYEKPFQVLLRIYKHYAKKSWDGNENLEDSLCIISRRTDETGMEYIVGPSIFKSDLDEENTDDESIRFFRLPYNKCLEIVSKVKEGNAIRDRTVNNYRRNGYKNPDIISFIQLYSDNDSGVIVNYSDPEKASSKEEHIKNAMNEVNSAYYNDKTLLDLTKTSIKHSHNFRSFFMKNFHELIEMINENENSVVGALIKYKFNSNIGVIVAKLDQDEWMERVIFYKYRENHYDSIIFGSFMLDIDETLEEFKQREEEENSSCFDDNNSPSYLEDY